jgi:hypothetical protein
VPRRTSFPEPALNNPRPASPRSSRDAQNPLRGYRSPLSARSSVVNGSFRGPKERRSFKPKVAGSNPVGRIPLLAVLCHFLALQVHFSADDHLARSGARRAIPTDADPCWLHFGYIGGASKSALAAAQGPGSDQALAFAHRPRVSTNFARPCPSRSSPKAKNAPPRFTPRRPPLGRAHPRFARSAPVVEVELGHPERRRQLVLHHLHPRRRGVPEARQGPGRLVAVPTSRLLRSGARRIRTADLLIANQALCQLSYSPEMLDFAEKSCRLGRVQRRV